MQQILCNASAISKENVGENGYTAFLNHVPNSTAKFLAEDTSSVQRKNQHIQPCLQKQRVIMF